MQLISQHGPGKWAFVARQIEGRCGKQCRERWQNHLSPDSKNNNEWTPEEEALLFELHGELGNRWAKIARCMPGRNDNAVKNHYYKRIGRYLKRGPKGPIAKQRLQRSEDDGEHGLQRWMSHLAPLHSAKSTKGCLVGETTDLEYSSIPNLTDL
eukprot:SAG11_NODE_3063_length_2717_cov_1.987777_1_plen_154_part_00